MSIESGPQGKPPATLFGLLVVMLVMIALWLANIGVHQAEDGPARRPPRASSSAPSSPSEEAATDASPAARPAVTDGAVAQTGPPHSAASARASSASAPSAHPAVSPSAATGSPSAAAGSPSAATGSPSAATGSPSAATGSPSAATGSASAAGRADDAASPRPALSPLADRARNAVPGTRRGEREGPAAPPPLSAASAPAAPSAAQPPPSSLRPARAPGVPSSTPALPIVGVTPPQTAAQDGTDASLEAADWEIAALGHPLESLRTRAVVLGVARVESRDNVCTVWAFACNLTGRDYEIPLRGMEVLGADGVPLEAGRYRPPGRNISLRAGQMLTMWPAYRLSPRAAQGSHTLAFRIRLDGYGNVTVPLVERMTNLGAFSELPPPMRDEIDGALASRPPFRWSGGK